MNRRSLPCDLRGRCTDESGFAGGAEALPFGVLVFVIGSLLLANAWGVIDAKIAASAAAREATRAYVESPGPTADDASRDAHLAAEAAFTGHGRDASKMTLQNRGAVAYARCAPITFEVSYPVPTISLPWVKALGPGAITVRASHSEVVDPYRSGVPSSESPTDTPCR
ncbi:MAG: hypothetical protein HYR89_03615 [Actinobacteria bacterium]|nr:hypothetical protein [Actinomycetota bacterium]